MSEERELLRETVAALVAKHASHAAVREAMESERGYDESLWRLLREQVGAAALVVAVIAVTFVLWGTNGPAYLVDLIAAYCL